MSEEIDAVDGRKFDPSEMIFVCAYDQLSRRRHTLRRARDINMFAVRQRHAKCLKRSASQMLA
ncbi:MAG TPA: hypothetical protein VF669_10370 [Tepidisphaeraceae bacterium]